MLTHGNTTGAPLLPVWGMAGAGVKRKRGRPRKQKPAVTMGQAVASGTRQQLNAKRSRWYCECSDEVAAKLKRGTIAYSLVWDVEDGLIFLRNKNWWTRSYDISIAILAMMLYPSMIRTATTRPLDLCGSNQLWQTLLRANEGP